jgi:hypothetical protein
MIDPRNTYEAVTRRTRRTKRSVGRLLFSGLGFSAAYFLDPDHGAARRRRVVEYVHRLGAGTIGTADVTADGVAAPGTETDIDPRLITRLSATRGGARS